MALSPSRRRDELMMPREEAERRRRLGRRGAGPGSALIRGGGRAGRCLENIERHGREEGGVAETREM